MQIAAREAEKAGNKLQARDTLTEPYMHATIHTNGINLHVVQAGPENGPLVILLHGFPEYWRGWAKQIGPLADAGLRVWVPDQRGYNLSDKPKGLSAYRIDTLAKDVLGLIEASGGEKACLAGHDWGAAVAWWTALRYPEKLRRLAILNVPHPAVMMRRLWANPAQLRKSWYIFFFQMPLLPEALIRRDNWAFAVRSLKGSSRRGTFNDEDIQLYRQAWGQKDAISSMLNWYRAVVQRPPKTPGGLRIRVPTLMLWGVQDLFLGRELAQPSLDLCDEGKLVFFEQATHWVQHEEAKKVNDLLIEFFESS
jgi:pimeloyl-ACP methyl ester carboxylesterase